MGLLSPAYMLFPICTCVWCLIYKLAIVRKSPNCHYHYSCMLEPLLSKSSVAQSCPTLCDPMDCSMPGFPVLHCLPEFAQTHIHWVGDAIQPSHPLLSPSPAAFNLSQHQGLLQWVSESSGGQSIGASASASVLPVSIQGWLPLGLTGCWSPRWLLSD